MKMKYDSIFIIFVKKFTVSQEKLGSMPCCDNLINADVIWFESNILFLIKVQLGRSFR